MMSFRDGIPAIRNWVKRRRRKSRILDGGLDNPFLTAQREGPYDPSCRRLPLTPLDRRPPLRNQSATAACRADVFVGRRWADFGIHLTQITNETIVLVIVLDNYEKHLKPWEATPYA
ncbi:hypothetical protein BHE74_00036417 [Ensete ventricosum]|nr:hypothetical protein BHE74_00036417 [Ensete ventricosum]RZS10960.1 hypothetical protein BHM03_00042239 [Ensete ventricosum]